MPADQPMSRGALDWVARRRRWIAAMGVLLLLLAGASLTIRHVGSWLVVQDRLEPAPVIVVLSGRMPERAREAAAIYGQGFASEVWISRPTSPAEELEEMGIAYVGEEFYSARVLMKLGVPSDAIRVLDRPAENTLEEVDGIAAELKRAGDKKVIMVTTKAHTRRVRFIWHKRVGDSPRAIVRFARDDSYDGSHWWRTTAGALDVVREVLGLANAWAGFPVRPAA
jgi:uncharacterized SAM-binding protein YcdF (DUF218 family)